MFWNGAVHIRSNDIIYVYALHRCIPFLRDLNHFLFVINVSAHGMLPLIRN